MGRPPEQFRGWLRQPGRWAVEAGDDDDPFVGRVEDIYQLASILPKQIRDRGLPYPHDELRQAIRRGADLPHHGVMAAEFPERAGGIAAGHVFSLRPDMIVAGEATISR